MEILDVQKTGTAQLTEQLAAVVAEVVRVLRAGGLIIFPTETTYGAGVDATNQAAVDKLLAYKTRREGKPLSIAVTDLAMAQQFVEVNESAQKIYDQFLPGPVTVVSKSLGKVATGVASEFGTLGVRIPDYPLVIEIVKKLGHPLTATSANASGKKRPYSIPDLLNTLSEKQKSLIDLVLDAGTLPPNPPSVVIDTTLSTPVTMRAGILEDAIRQSTVDVGNQALGNRAECTVYDTFAQTTLISSSEAETKSIAGRLLLKHWNDVKETGLVIGLNGPLGAGKTIFVKGLAEFLQIKEPVVSPTYTYMQEYHFVRHGVKGKLFHLDLWKIDSAEELARLELKELFQPNTVVAIEWWGQVKSWLPQLLRLKNLIEVNIIDDDSQQRKLSISFEKD